MNGKQAAQVSVEPTEIDCPSSSEVLDDVYMHANPSVIDLYTVGRRTTHGYLLRKKKYHLHIGYGYTDLRVRLSESMLCLMAGQWLEQCAHQSSRWSNINFMVKQDPQTGFSVWLMA